MSLAMQSLMVRRAEAPSGLVAIPVRTPLVRPGDDLIAIGRRSRARHRSTRRRRRDLRERRCDRARRVRRRRARSPVAAGVRALAARRRTRDDEPAGIGAAGHRSRRRVEGDLRDASAGHRARMRTARRVLRGAGRSGGGIRRVHRHDAAVRARDRVLSQRSAGHGARVSRANAASSAPSSTRTISARPRCSARPTACARASSRRRCCDNPHGNSDEQTPVVVLKWRGSGLEPAVRASDVNVFWASARGVRLRSRRGRIAVLLVALGRLRVLPARIRRRAADASRQDRNADDGRPGLRRGARRRVRRRARRAARRPRRPRRSLRGDRRGRRHR